MSKIKKPKNCILDPIWCEIMLVGGKPTSELVEASIHLDCMVKLDSMGQEVRLTLEEVDVLIPWLEKASAYLKGKHE